MRRVQFEQLLPMNWHVALVDRSDGRFREGLVTVWKWGGPCGISQEGQGGVYISGHVFGPCRATIKLEDGERLLPMMRVGMMR